MVKVAYLGPQKTNTHLAALEKFGSQAKYLHAPTIEDVFHLVERGQTTHGVVPVENSLEGAVAHTLDRFIDFLRTPVKIQGELERVIRHHFITHPNVGPENIRAVYSHPQALAQCHRWLNEHCPRALLRETTSTADAVFYVLSDKNKETRAAIGIKSLASKHGLQAIAIPTGRENKTRFLIIGLDDPKRGRHNKTSVLLALHDRPGALHDVLVPFKKNKINLTKIESRPSKRKAWEYVFFIDFDGHESDASVKRTLATLKHSTQFVKVLGSYPVKTSRA